MISSRDLESLLAWKPPPGQSVLSLYVDSKATRGVWNLSEFEKAARSALREVEGRVDERDRSQFETASKAILSRLTSQAWSGRSLVAFNEANGNSHWERELRVPVRSQAHWGSTPFVRPLIEAIEEYERYAVVLTDKTRARLFTIFLGEIEEERDAFNPETVKHVSSTGMDQIRTDLQPRSEEHARRHLKHVAGMLDAIERARRFDRLILGGASEATHELRRLLSKRLASRIIGLVHLPVEAQVSDVLRETLELERQAQGNRQKERVEELTTAAAKGERAVVGLEATLAALRDARVWRLIYVENLALAGSECTCGGLFKAGVTSCSLCGETPRPVEDLVEKLSEKVAEEGGRVEPVSNAAAASLEGVGGIGAFLRF